MNFKNRSTPHSVYVLIKDNKAVYVGCSMNVFKRVKNHRSTGKIFDSHIILKTYKNKGDALLSEAAIIRFLSVFDDGIILNAKYDSLTDVLKHK